MKKLFSLILILFGINILSSQSVGIGTSSPHSSALLELKNTTKGFLVPRTSSTSRLSIASPAKGLLVYDTTFLSFYAFNGNTWNPIAQSNTAWALSGNIGTNPSQFLGTIDKKNIRLRVNNQTIGILDTLEGNIGFGIGALQGTSTFANRNIALGTGTLNKLSVGDQNVAIGDSALSKAIFGSSGIAIGTYAMKNALLPNSNIAIGINTLTKVNNYSNIAIGTTALFNNVLGTRNIGVGENALGQNVNSNNNVSLGNNASSLLSEGNGNISIGTSAMLNSTNGESQIAIGDSALYSQTTNVVSSPQLAIGKKALYTSTGIGSSTAIGHYSQEKLSSALNNTTLGFNTMKNSTSGRDNTVLGFEAMKNKNSSSYNVAIGSFAMGGVWSQTNSVAIGYKSMENNAGGNAIIAIGRATANLAESESIAIGDSCMALSGGSLNIGIGINVLKKNEGQCNIGIGPYAMANSTNFSFGNTALGIYSLFNNSIGRYNTGIGYESLKNNSLGESNFANGYRSLFSNTYGYNNVAIGYETLFLNSTGSGNIAIGRQALRFNSDKSANIAIGDSSLRAAIGDPLIGLNSIAIGRKSMSTTTTGYNNTAIGYSTLQNNITGKRITALGYSADVDIDSTNINNATVIGNNATVGESNTMAFGNTNTLNWAFGRKKVVVGVALQIGNNPNNGNGANLTEGGVWTNASDKNKKDDLQNIDGSSLLQKMKELEIQRWKYIGTNEYHIGPYAQQFKQLFEVGNDDTSISTIDPSGVALVAIKELMQIIENQQKQIDELKAKMK